MGQRCGDLGIDPRPPPLSRAARDQETRPPLALTCVAAAVPDGSDFIATGPEPWLAVGLPSLRDLAGSLASFTYRASLWDPPARPVFRFLRHGDVLSEAIAPAPLEAAAIFFFLL